MKVYFPGYIRDLTDHLVTYKLRFAALFRYHRTLSTGKQNEGIILRKHLTFKLIYN